MTITLPSSLRPGIRSEAMWCINYMSGHVQQSFASKRMNVMCRRSVLRKAVGSIYNDAVSNSRKEPSNWGSGKKELQDGPDTLVGFITFGLTRKPYPLEDSKLSTATKFNEIPEALCRRKRPLQAATVVGRRVAVRKRIATCCIAIAP
jgi:hypothetical protein